MWRAGLKRTDSARQRLQYPTAEVGIIRVLLIVGLWKYPETGSFHSTEMSKEKTERDFSM